MKLFALDVQVPTGALLIGGHANTPAGVHAMQAERSGKAFVPATALRGALREAAERILLAAGQPACLGATGTSDPDEPPKPHCQLGANDQPCLACQLFGTATDDLAGRSRSGRLVLSDAQPIGAAPLRDRPGVGIDRAHRTASEGILYNFRGTSPGEALTFRAEGYLEEVEGGPLHRLLQAAVRLTEHIGRGSSRGLGRVKLVLAEPSPSRAPAVPAPGALSSLRIRVRLASPTAIGEALPRSNERDTRMEIPGPSLRGAVVFAADAARPEAQEAIAHLAQHAIFETLYPEGERLNAAQGILPAPWPLTTHLCKTEAWAHGLADDLLDRLAFRVAEQAGTLPTLPSPECKRCSEPSALKRLSGPRTGARPRTRLLTRVALDRDTHSARHGALFSQVVLDEGQSFTGIVRNLTPEAAELLHAAFEHGVSVGHGRSYGRGRLELAGLHAAPVLPDLATRLGAFAAAWATVAPSFSGRHLLPVTLLSPLLVPEGSDGTALLAGALRLDERACLLSVRRFGIERGWNMEPHSQEPLGPRTPTRTVEGGGVFVFELPAPLDAQQIEHLESLEARGIGERTTSGFGRVLFFDPIHLRRQS